MSFNRLRVAKVCMLHRYHSILYDISAELFSLLRWESRLTYANHSTLVLRQPSAQLADIMHRVRCAAKRVGDNLKSLELAFCSSADVSHVEHMFTEQCIRELHGCFP